MRSIFLLFFLFVYFPLFSQWTTLNSGTSSFLVKVFFPSQDTGYVIKADGAILQTVDGGNNWVQISPIETAYNFYFTSPNTGYALESYKIKKTIDGGNTWDVKFSDSIISKLEVFFPDENNGFVAGVNNSLDTFFVYKTSDAGETWVKQGIFSKWYVYPSDIFFTDSITGYISSVMSIYKTIDGGISWVEQYNDTTAFSEIQSVFFPSKDTGCAVGGSIYWTFDAGLTWSKQPTLGNPLYSVFFSSNNNGYAVGGNGFNSGSVIKTIDGGTNWTLATPQIATFNSVFFPNENTGFAVGSNGTIIKYSDSTTVNLENSLVIDKTIIYPNPSLNGIFFIYGDMNEISVTTALGKEIFSKKHFKNSSLQIDISSHPKGIYFVTINGHDERITKKIILI